MPERPEEIFNLTNVKNSKLYLGQFFLGCTLNFANHVHYNYRVILFSDLERNVYKHYFYVVYYGNKYIFILNIF